MVDVIKIEGVTVAYLSVSYFIAVLAVILNIIEIYLILKKRHHATNFEVVLFNLAVADLLTGVGFFIVTSISTYMYVGQILSNRLLAPSFAIMALSISSSIFFVIFIGIERLIAIKLPIRHRMWHAKRSTIFKWAALAWVFTVIMTAVSLTADQMIQKDKQGFFISVGSRNLALFIASYMTLGSIIVLVIYCWITYLVLKRRSKFLAFDKTDLERDKNMVVALQKEKATIIVCALVVATFLACNVPIIVGFYKNELNAVEANLVNFSSVVNPLVYFFKGYIEDYFSKAKLEITSQPKKTANVEKITSFSNVGCDDAKRQNISET
ncbi:somatostatin receptor type 5-like [Rhopilema esculentum]|uniref:somatostatin receptor type 5-like n=1 Tax=Rhopilema esculentum TaxID=499914 RepID=UPI0031E0E337|eukprot:gene8476-14467_t